MPERGAAQAGSREGGCKNAVMVVARTQLAAAIDGGRATPAPRQSALRQRAAVEPLLRCARVGAGAETRGAAPVPGAQWTWGRVAARH